VDGAKLVVASEEQLVNTNEPMAALPTTRPASLMNSLLEMAFFFFIYFFLCHFEFSFILLPDQTLVTFTHPYLHI